MKRLLLAPMFALFLVLMILPFVSMPASADVGATVTTQSVQKSELLNTNATACRDGLAHKDRGSGTDDNSASMAETLFIDKRQTTIMKRYRIGKGKMLDFRKNNGEVPIRVPIPLQII